jgi:hypothetical protein
MKICTKCDIEKELIFFGKDKNTKDGYKFQCKNCRNISNKKYRDNNEDYYKKYREKNKEKNKEYQIKYREQNSEIIKDYKKNYKLKNNEKIKESNHFYYLKNKENILKRNKKWVGKNKEKNNETKKEWYNKKRKEDNLFHLRTNISNLIRKSLKSSGFGKNNKTCDIIGCSYDELLSKLNNNKYGFLFEDGLYDIDHIIPVSIAKSESELLELNNYKNLQLIPIDYNRYIKRNNKWDIEEFEEWLKHIKENR